MANPVSETSTYPTAFDDTSNSWPAPASGDDYTITLAGRVRDAILKVQKELGLNPSGIFSTLNERLDNIGYTKQPNFIINKDGPGIFGENDFLQFQDMNVANHGILRNVGIGWNQDFEFFYFKKDIANTLYGNFMVDSTILFDPAYMAYINFYAGEFNITGTTHIVGGSLTVPSATSGSYFFKLGNASYAWEDSSLDLRFHVGRYVSFRRGDATQSLNAAYFDLNGTDVYFYSSAGSSNTTRFVASSSDLWLTTLANNKNIIFNPHGTGWVNLANNTGLAFGSGVPFIAYDGSARLRLGTNSFIVFNTGATSPASIGTERMYMDSNGLANSSDNTNFDLGAWNRRWGICHLHRMQSTMRAPGIPSGTPSTTGGNIAAGTYLYRVTAIDAAGSETEASAASSSVVTTGSTSSVSVSFTAVAGACNYKLYRSSNAGSTYGLLATVTASASPQTYLDTATSNGATTTPPSTSSAAAIMWRQGQGATYSYIGHNSTAADQRAILIRGGTAANNLSRNLLEITDAGGSRSLSFGINTYSESQISGSNNLIMSVAHGRQLSLGNSGFTSTVPFYNSHTTNLTANTTQMMMGYRSIRFAQQSGDNADAGSILYRRYDTEALEIVGAGANNSSRLVRVYDYIGVGVTPSTSYSATLGGPININSGVSGAALYSNAIEMLWYNNTYASWGLGATYNYFDKPITIGNSANPSSTALWVKGKSASVPTFVLESASSQTADFIQAIIGSTTYFAVGIDGMLSIGASNAPIGKYTIKPTSIELLMRPINGTSVFLNSPASNSGGALFRAYNLAYTALNQSNAEIFEFGFLGNGNEAIIQSTATGTGTRRQMKLDANANLSSPNLLLRTDGTVKAASSIEATNISRVIYDSPVYNTAMGTNLNPQAGAAAFVEIPEYNNTPVIKCLAKYKHRKGDKYIRVWFKAKTGDEFSTCSGTYGLWVNGSSVATIGLDTGGFWDIVSTLSWTITGLADGQVMDVGLAAQCNGCGQVVWMKEVLILAESI